MDRKISSKLISDFIAAGKRPRNQIATLSGLTNTYIRNLEKGEIENVPKNRIIALGVALNLDLTEIDELLFAFDRSQLTDLDIPVFIETAKKAKLSEAVLPVRDLSAYELIILSMEQFPGRQVIVNDRPTASLMVEGHRSHTDRRILSCHPIYKNLIEAIGAARRDNFHRLISEHLIDHYICKSCLEDYLKNEPDIVERAFRYRHVAEILNIVRSYDNFRLFLTDACHNLSFTIKFSDKSGVNDKLSYSSRAPHALTRGKRGRLIGFLTENLTLCECFKEELLQVDKTKNETLAVKEHQEDYLCRLLAPIAAELGEHFEN